MKHDVLIIGGGPAGCSTAVFTARYGLDTLVLDRGSSSIQQCAFIENYLGFPGGIDVDTFYAMSQAHAERVGATVIEEMVTALSETECGFHVTTEEGEYTAERVVAASTYDVTYLESVVGEHFLSEDGETWLDPELAGEHGETPVDGLWIAGPAAGVESQIAVAVGHGARVGRAVIEEYRRQVENYWGEAADYYSDWVVQQGRYPGEEWLENVTEIFVESAPSDIDEKLVQTKAREVVKERQNMQIGTQEVERRTKRAHRQLLDYVSDELILEYAREIDGEDLD